MGFSPLAKKIGISPTLANSRHPMILIITSLASGTFLPLLPLYLLSLYSFLEIYTRMTGWSEYAYCSEQSIGYRAFAHLVGMCARQMNTMLCYCCKGKEQQRNIISSRNCSNCSTELAKWVEREGKPRGNVNLLALLFFYTEGDKDFNRPYCLE